MRRSRFKRMVSTVAALILGSASLSAAATSPVQAAETVVQLPTSSYSHMLVDEAHGHVLITTGKLGSPTQALLVYDLSGNLLQTVGASYLSVPSGMTLSADGSVLFVATSGNIFAYDAQTLDYLPNDVEETPNNGGGWCGSDIGWAGGKLWYSLITNTVQYPPDCSTESYNFYSQVNNVTYTPGTWNLAHLRWTSGAQLPGKIVAADTYGQSYSYVQEFDGTTTSPAQTAWRTYSATSTTAVPVAEDLALSADGKLLALADGASGFRLLNTSDLSDSAQNYGAPPAGAVATSVAYSGDGVLVARGAAASGSDADLLVQSADPAQTGTPREYVFSDAAQGGDRVAERGLAFTHDGSKLFAITTNSDGSAYWLHVITQPGQQYASTFSPLTVQPASPVVGEPLTLSGKLQLDGPTPTPSDQVTAVRIDADGTQTLAPASVAADGSFTINDTPRDAGTAQYTVSFGGDESHYPAQDATLTVSVAKAPTSIALTAPAEADTETGVQITGILTASGPALPSGATVQVQRTTKAGTVTLAPAGVAADGTFAIDDNPQKNGDATYTVTYAGDAWHEASSASATVQFGP